MVRAAWLLALIGCTSTPPEPPVVAPPVAEDLDHHHFIEAPPWTPDEPTSNNTVLPEGAFFQDVTDAAGVTYRGQTYGQGWGDYNGDGFLDLWVGNHANAPKLFVNRGDGTFYQRTDELVAPSFYLDHDAHGVLWVDLDSDGDEDLVELVGSGGDNRAYINQAGYLLDAASDLGITYTTGSGRCPLAMDWNLDGRIDLLLTNQARADGLNPTALFTQLEDGSFALQAEVPEESQHPTALCGMLADLDGDHELDLVRFSKPSHISVHDAQDGAMRDISDQIGVPDTSLVNDVAIADFDNDGRNEIYVTRWQEISEGIFNPDIPRIRMTLRVNNTAEGVRFRSDGEIDISLEPPWFWGPADPQIGPSCFRPFRTSFSLDPTDLGVQGACPFTPGGDQGLYAWREEDEWVVMLSVSVWQRGNIDITSAAPIEDVQWQFRQHTPEEISLFFTDVLYVPTTDGYVDEAVERGFEEPQQCSSVVAFDVDNDMDLDLYMACASPVQNLPNRLYLNDGTGHFTLFDQTLHGAEGPTGGRADSVIVGDYDADGFLDLFITNGFAAPPLASRGPNKLFHNRGNDNHWIQVDLRGTQSHVDAIGSTVFVTAGGVTQQREVGSETHSMGQNQRRVHVGLGPHETIDEIKVRWPTGAEQVLANVAADQILEIVEL
jgi:hypothetical protein